MHALARLKSAIRAVPHHRRGVAAAEFALIAPVVIALLFGVYDIGSVVHQQLLLLQALRAGGLYALAFPTQLGADTSAQTPNNGILLAIQQALPASWTDVVLNPPEVANGSGKFAPPPGVAPYFTGGPPYFIQLTASRPYMPLWALFWPASFTNNGASYVIRVQ